jgi:hypothetical protein
MGKIKFFPIFFIFVKIKKAMTNIASKKNVSFKNFNYKFKKFFKF